MSYLKLKRARIILTSFLLSSLLLVEFPGIDLGVSKLFFDKSFYLGEMWWNKLLHVGLGPFICLSMLAILGVYIHNRFSKRNLLGIDGKKISYLLLVLIVGAGLIVNVMLKDQFGRARPRDLEEFGGSMSFSAAFVMSHECQKNCSFSSGHVAGAFVTFAFVFALCRKRAMFLAALGFGTLMSVSRIASGAHFLSDCLVSFFVMLITSDVLYYYMVSATAELFESGFGVPSAHQPGIAGLAIEEIAVPLRVRSS